MEIETTETDADQLYEVGLPSIKVSSPRQVSDSGTELIQALQRLPSLKEEHKETKPRKMSSKRNKSKPNLMTKSILLKLKRKELPPKYEDDYDDELESADEDRRTPPHRFNKYYQKNERVHSPVPFKLERNTDKLEYYNSLIMADDTFGIRNGNQHDENVEVSSPTKKSSVNFDLCSRQSSRAERDLKRIEDAYSSVKMYQKIQREDKAMGVKKKNKEVRLDTVELSSDRVSNVRYKSAPDSSRVQSTVSRKTTALSRISYQHSESGISRASTSLSKFSNAQSRADSTATSSSKNTFRSVIPSGYQFPKGKDFIPREGTKIDNMGVDWNVSKDSEIVGEITRKSVEKPITASQIRSTIPGKLCRNSHPVTDSLNKEGVSVSKRRYKTLHYGQMDTAKVWKRNLDNPSVCLKQIAKEDIPFSSIKHLIPSEKPPEKISLYSIMKVKATRV